MKDIKNIIGLLCFLTIGCASYTPFIGQLDYNPIYEWDLNQKVFMRYYPNTILYAGNSKRMRREL